jgi:hypothetical protein
MKRYLIGGFLFGAAFAVFMLVFLVVKYDRNNASNENQITNFEECLAAGYQASQTHPRHCFVPAGPNLPGGQSFTESLPSSNKDNLEFVTINQGQYGLEQKQNMVIIEQTKWQKLWLQLHPDDNTPPNIDLPNYAIVAVFAGQKSSGGHEVTIDRIIQEGNGFKAYATERYPGENCAGIDATTYPYHIVALKLPYPEGIDKTLYIPGWSIDTFEFETTQEINDC